MDYQEIKIAFLTYLSRSGSTLLARLLDEYDDVCVTTEGELPLELFGVKSYSPITFDSQQDLELYLNNILAKTRAASWNIPNDQMLTTPPRQLISYMNTYINRWKNDFKKV